MPNNIEKDLSKSVNFVRIIGMIERSPRLHKNTKTTVLTFFVRTKEPFVHSSGTSGLSVESHRVVVFGTEAEDRAGSLAVGRDVRVEGRLRTRKWTDDKGMNRWITEIIAREIEVISERAA